MSLRKSTTPVAVYLDYLLGLPHYLGICPDAVRGQPRNKREICYKMLTFLIISPEFDCKMATDTNGTFDVDLAAHG